MMHKLKNWLDKTLFWLKTGHRLQIANDGKPIEQLVIRYKDLFFMIDLDAETLEPTGSFGWSQGTPMTHIPIREHYVASRPQARKDGDAKE